MPDETWAQIEAADAILFGATGSIDQQGVVPPEERRKGSLLRKSRGTRDEQLATLRAFLAYMWAHPGKQLIFMGSEFAQESEWAEGRSLDWWLLDQPAHT